MYVKLFIKQALLFVSYRRCISCLNLKVHFTHNGQHGGDIRAFCLWKEIGLYIAYYQRFVLECQNIISTFVCRKKGYHIFVFYIEQLFCLFCWDLHNMAHILIGVINSIHRHIHKLHTLQRKRKRFFKCQWNGHNISVFNKLDMVFIS